MKKYILKKDLPTFEVGCVFEINNDGALCFVETANGDKIKTINNIVYSAEQLKRYPNILTEWFEEVPEEPHIPGQYIAENPYVPAPDRFGFGPGIHPAAVGGSKEKSEDYASVGLSFETYEECQRWIDKHVAEQVLLRDTKGFKTNWPSSIVCPSWKVSYSYSTKSLGAWTLQDNDGTIRFATKRDAEASIKAHEKEWKTYLGVSDE